MCVCTRISLGCAAKFKDDTNGKSAREFQIKLGPGRASHVYNELSTAEIYMPDRGKYKIDPRAFYLTLRSFHLSSMRLCFMRSFQFVICKVAVQFMICYFALETTENY